MLIQGDQIFLKLLEFSPFEQRRGRWWFGTRRIGETVVSRLIASGRAEVSGERLVLKRWEPAE
jgi:hypothetical protein